MEEGEGQAEGAEDAGHIDDNDDGDTEDVGEDGSSQFFMNTAHDTSMEGLVEATGAKGKGGFFTGEYSALGLFLLSACIAHALPVPSSDCMVVL